MKTVGCAGELSKNTCFVSLLDLIRTHLNFSYANLHVAVLPKKIIITTGETGGKNLCVKRDKNLLPELADALAACDRACNAAVYLLCSKGDGTWVLQDKVPLPKDCLEAYLMQCEPSFSVPVLQVRRKKRDFWHWAEKHEVKKTGLFFPWLGQIVHIGECDVAT